MRAGIIIFRIPGVCIEFVIQVLKQKNAHVSFPVGMVSIPIEKKKKEVREHLGFSEVPTELESTHPRLHHHGLAFLRHGSPGPSVLCQFGSFNATFDRSSFQGAGLGA